MGRSIEAPVFWPTKADMATESSFERYIESIEKEVASVGICKIVAPKVSLHVTGCAACAIAIAASRCTQTCTPRVRVSACSRRPSVDSKTAAVMRAAEHEQHRVSCVGLDTPSARLLDPAGCSDPATHTAACIGQVRLVPHDPGRGEADVAAV